MIDRIKCLIYRHRWDYIKFIDPEKQAVYKCIRCGKTDKV